MANAKTKAAATTPRLGLRERKKADVRSTILTVAERLFRERGYQETSMADIADGANIARKTLFNYVTSKESIILALIDVAIGAHMPAWLEEAVPFHHDTRDVGTPNWERRLNEIAKHRWLLTLAAENTSFFTGGTTKYVSETMQRNTEARMQRIAAVQAAGGMRADISPKEISDYYETLRDLSVRTWLLTPKSTAKDLRRTFGNAMQVLQQGIAPPR